MIWFVVIVGCLNLLLGFLLAVALTEPPPWSHWMPAQAPAAAANKASVFGRLLAMLLRLAAILPPILARLPRWDRIRRVSAVAANSDASAAASDASPESTASVTSGDVCEPLEEALRELPAGTTVGFRLEELPRRWLETLTSEGISPGSLLEATAQVMRLEVGPYRSQLMTVENRCRAALAEADADALKQLCTDLVAINRDWHDRQMEAAELIKERSGTHGDYEQAAMDLEQALHDQAATIKDCEVTVDSLHHRTEIETGCKRVFESIGLLVDQAHLLRDRLNDLLATVLRDAGNLAEVTTELQLDQVTGLLNRIGAELLFDDWWQADPDRTRHLSAALIDIDRLGRVNQRLGTRVGDQTIAALARLLGEIFRRDRGTDRVVRLTGQSLLIFLGDTGPHSGLSAIERARQTIEATTWDSQGSEFELTISTAVTDVRADDKLPAILRRLTEAVKFAKLAGRNRAAIDEGEGPKLLDPPQFNVKGRVIAVGEE
ncbi:MAG: GGDEF domain-containing protein [Pirellulaceae bacterium]|nr:GGDEF domain-containing protein [Pirellulaceae bacterium]